MKYVGKYVTCSNYIPLQDLAHAEDQTTPYSILPVGLSQ